MLEGGGKAAMQLKDIGAVFLSMFPGNADLRRAFAFLREAREQENHIAVQLRASLRDLGAGRGEPASCAGACRRWRSASRAGATAKATTVVGDPLEGVMSTAPGLALASTANPSLALLGDALAMLPWNRTASPWERGSVLFRRPDGGIWPYDPAGGRKRPLVVDIFVAPPGSGKSVLANTINIGLCLSTAVMGTNGAKLPLIGKADIGRSAEGFVRLIQEALGPQRAARGDLRLACSSRRASSSTSSTCRSAANTRCRWRRPSCRTSWRSATLPPDETTPFEGMAQLISLVIDEAYRLCTEVRRRRRSATGRASSREVDEALAGIGIKLDHDAPYWRDVVNALCDAGRIPARRAGAAPRRADPGGPDRRRPHRPGAGHVRQPEAQPDQREGARQIFERYISDLIRRFPTLNAPTQLDFGPARIIVLDLQYVAPTGSAAANRQTEMMYLLARHILARNFFLHPEYAALRPGAGARLPPQALPRGLRDASSALDYDEWHRTAGQPAGARAGRTRRARGPQAQRAARLRQPAPVRHGRRHHRAVDRPLRAAAPTISASARRSSSASG